MHIIIAGMRVRLVSFISVSLLSFAAYASNEGVPSYYQNNTTTTVNQAAYGQYQEQGYTRYVGQSGSKQVVGSRSYSYQVPRQTLPQITGSMTTNGIAVPVAEEAATTVYAKYARKFADFEFETGVNSILEWDDMVYNEIGVGVQHNFSLRNFDMFAYGEYSMGFMSHGGLSMDYDLKPYYESDPSYGIFTISVGDQTGKTNHFKLGIGAHHVWDIGGWKLSPSFGYEIFNHNLEMSDHLYPNPGIFLPLMTNKGDYVYGDVYGNYFSLPINVEAPEDWYQVCMSPEDIKLVQVPAGGALVNLGTELTMGDYNSDMGTVPWGVDSGECVIIGGDGPILVDGTTHIYNTTWSGFYVGLEIEKQMTLVDKLRFYVQFGLPKYSSEGIWPNRTDWQQNPSFIDEGSNDAYSYSAEMEYNYKLSDRMQLSIMVDTDYFYVGKIGGELYLSEYTQYVLDENGMYVLDDNGLPILETVPASTQYISDQLKHAAWQSFGLHVGIKYAF